MNVNLQRRGGYPRFVEEGFNDAYLPVWLQGAGESGSTKVSKQLLTYKITIPTTLAKR
jgi:hypothetical protein